MVGIKLSCAAEMANWAFGKGISWQAWGQFIVFWYQGKFVVGQLPIFIGR
jgi:hypothetical protein